VWLTSLNQFDIDWLLARGISTQALVRPTAALVATGAPGPDGQFEHDDAGECWLAFEEAEDFVFWQPSSGRLAPYAGCAFALGEEAVDNPGTDAFDCALNIFADPLDWLRASRDGIVVLDWSRAFERLRDVPRIAIAEALLPLYRRNMKPSQLPELFVIAGERRAA
jgi:hypothetical protein